MSSLDFLALEYKFNQVSALAEVAIFPDLCCYTEPDLVYGGVACGVGSPSLISLSLLTVVCICSLTTLLVVSCQGLEIILIRSGSIAQAGPACAPPCYVSQAAGWGYRCTSHLAMNLLNCHACPFNDTYQKTRMQGGAEETAHKNTYCFFRRPGFGFGAYTV